MRRIGGPKKLSPSAIGAACEQLFGKAHGDIVFVGRNDQRRKPAEGGQPAAFARLELVGVERLAVALDHRLHHRMAGMIGLQKRAAGLCGAPGPTGDLGEDLEGLFRGARIAMRKPEIGIEHPHQRQLSK